MVVKAKNILISGITGGIVLLVVTYVADVLSQVLAPYSIFDLGGMRAMNDPLMTLYFLYPFIFAFIAAIIWSWIRNSITGTILHRAGTYGVILFLLVIIPNTWVIVTTMTYPIGFHFSNILCGIIAYPLIGYLNVRYNSE
jgi:hypothetical protein